MPLLSLDPAPILETADSGLLLFRDNIQLNYNKIQDIVNNLDSVNIKDASLTQMDSAYTMVGWTRVSMGATNTGSAVYVDVPGWVDLPFTKQYTPTQLFFTLFAGAWHTAAGNNADFGIRVNGVDNDIAHFFFNQAGVHQAFGAVLGGYGGLAAGNYLARLRWKTSAAGLNIDGNDLFSLKIEELRW